MDYSLIKPYIEKKLVSEQAHPENPDVRIFNYTQHCQFEAAWDEVTKNCRGLIMNVATGEVLARPFAKFFNYQEHVNNGWPIPAEIPYVVEKLDGSLGIMYSLEGKSYIATRGSFTSDQAMWATNWWRENYGEEAFGGGYTHLFEIIYPENRIVVNYDFSGLVYLDSINIETGRSDNNGGNLKAVDIEGKPIRFAKTIPATSLYELSKLNEPNSEGFVAYYPEANVRIKLKFPEYVRLHKLITGVSEIVIWEHMAEGKDLKDLIEKVPDEFMKWVQSVQERLEYEYNAIWGSAIVASAITMGFETRKGQAEWLMQNEKGIAGIVFSLLDQKTDQASKAVWKRIRPRGASQFKNDVDS